MKKSNNLPDVDPVELKPIFGLRPGLVILLSGVILLLLLLFLVFMLPGIVSNACYIQFNSNAKNVAIYDNGKYLGSSEGTVYKVESGEHEFAYSVNGIDAYKESINIKKSIFFTLFHRHVTNIDISIKNTPEIEAKAKEEFITKAVSWSKVLDYDTSYPMPPMFSEFAYNASALSFSNIEDVWLYAAMHMTSKTMYEDYLEGKSILERKNIAFTSKELTELDAKLEEMYSDRAKSTLTSSLNNNVIATKSGDYYQYQSQDVELGTDTTLTYPDVNTSSTIVHVKSFKIAQVPVSEYEYSLFVSDNPKWAKSNKDTLISEGLVDENYLDGITLSTSVKSLRPIRNISYYAATAYTEWLTSKTGKNYSLPTEAEWTVAALSAKNKKYTSSLIGIDTDTSSPSFMLGQLWEMTDTQYVPLQRISDYDKAQSLAEDFGTDSIIVKGGSYINYNDGITLYSVGVSEKNASSEFMGFRIVEHE